MPRQYLSAILVSLLLSGVAFCFPNYASLAGLSARELDTIIPHLTLRALPSPPGPLSNPLAKLVNDPAHPFIAPVPTDMRGPCPGLNTLANHGVCRTFFTLSLSADCSPLF